MSIEDERADESYRKAVAEASKTSHGIRQNIYALRVEFDVDHDVRRGTLTQDIIFVDGPSEAEIEAAARAIMKTSWPNSDWDEWAEDTQADFRNEARAALMAALSARNTRETQ